jgi:hypothetical protein
MRKKKAVGREKSTMTEPQEEFISDKNVPTRRKESATPLRAKPRK